MSASNWTTCPKCWDRAQTAAREAREAVMALYGTVPVGEFDAARTALEDPDEETCCTFREDYEFYDAETGEVRASYSGGCTRCGLSVDLKASKKFWP